jgi:hypothetical protein
MTAMMRLWSGSFLVIGLTGGIWAQGPVKRYPVTDEMVVSAMKERALPVEGVQVRIAAPITASVANPMLEIETLRQVDAHSVQMRLSCRNRPECLTFFVSATWASVPTAVSLAPKIALPETRLGTEPAGSATLRAGSPAVLVIEDEKVHIRMRVVCLQAGGAGDTVRVTTPDHRQAYAAEIVGPSVLRGSFTR